MRAAVAVVLLATAGPEAAHAILAKPAGMPDPSSPVAVVERPCPPEVTVPGPRCGTLSVPEDHDQPSGRRIDLSIAIVPAPKPHPGRAPLYVLSGGPGLPTVGTAGDLMAPGLKSWRHTEIVLVDRRGTGGSAPLRCPELERRSVLERMYPPELVTACRADLERNADLTRYSTTEAARDIDEVRAALGQEKIDLYGLSYGTQLAREVIWQSSDYRVREQMGAGALWSSRPPPPEFLAPPPLPQVPALFITGTMDGVTPPILKDEILRRWPNGAVVEMPHATHVYFTWSAAAECLDSIAIAFLEKGSVEGLHTSCTLRAAPPPFDLPGGGE